MKYYLAIDLGATGGRHIIGYKQNNEIVLEKIHQFPTGMDESENGLIWNLDRIFVEIKKGIKKAFEKYNDITSISIDTWGVDYVLMNGDKEIPPFYSYRNERNIQSAEKLHKLVPFSDIYKVNGIQFMAYNTIYQLFDDLHKGRLTNATDYLMLPSYFTYKLTGKKTHEYTNETTGALIDSKTNNYAYELFDKVGLPRKLFTKIEQPGHIVGDLLPEVANEVGGNTKVVLCASHDTASAFEAVEHNDGIILSSGTWSLIGIKTPTAICTEESLKANFTNEGGINYIRFLKNIMGMWIVNQLVVQDDVDFMMIIPNLPNVSYKEIFDVNDQTLVAPKDMKEAIINLLKHNPPKNDEELLNSVYHSMAKAYKDSCDVIEQITKRKYDKLYIVGGGAKNLYLNSLIEKYTSKKVIVSCIEATSYGNIKVQMETL